MQNISVKATSDKKRNPILGVFLEKVGHKKPRKNTSMMRLRNPAWKIPYFFQGLVVLMEA